MVHSSSTSFTGTPFVLKPGKGSDGGARVAPCDPAVLETATMLEDAAFAWALKEQPKLLQALVARYGSDMGEQATAAAMAWAWEHKDRLVEVTALRAYLFRVGQSSMRRSWVWAFHNSATFPTEVADSGTGQIEEALDLAVLLRKLPQKQRTCMLLIHAHGWPYRDVAELLDISVDAVNNHTHRGMNALRKLTKNTAREDQS